MIPLVSVIIPNYNHGPYLKERLDSIFRQTYQKIEVIILDDSSTDNSREIINSYRENFEISNVVFNTENSGSPFQQWIRGIELAKGDYIWIAESDDLAEITFLENLVKKLKNGVTLAYCQSWDTDHEGTVLGSRQEWTSEFEPNFWVRDFELTGTNFLRFLKVKNVVPNVSACLIRRDVLKDVMENNPGIGNLKYCGDWYVWVLLCRFPGARISFISDHLNYFRVTDTSTRHFNGIEKKQRRLLEELYVINQNRWLFTPAELSKRFEQIKTKWFTIHNKSNFGISFFKISPFIGLNTLKLFIQFFFYKCKKK